MSASQLGTELGTICTA